MELWEITDRELGDAHAETLAKAKSARARNDLDLAQRYLRVMRGYNVEMHNRIQARRGAA